MSEGKKPAHRPKEPFVPWDGWKEDIIGLYSEGASDVEIRGLIMDKSVDRDTCTFDLWDRWLNEEEDFSKTIKKGREKCQVWWENNGRVNLKDSSFSATLWYMNMKNRFNWADKQEIKADVNQTVTDLSEEEIDKKIADLQKKQDKSGK